MDFKKTVKSPNDISAIAQQVLERINEPDLTGKNIQSKVLPADQYENCLEKLCNGTSVNPAETKGYTVMHIPSKRYLILIREASFGTAFSTYFHELGHVATEETVSGLNIHHQHNNAYTEALAYSFEGYAKEKFNELGHSVRFMDTFTPKLRAAYIDKAIDNLEIPAHKEAFQIIKAMLLKGKNTYEEVYKTLKNGAMLLKGKNTYEEVYKTPILKT